MQTAKIIIGDIYAINLHGQPVRFRVDAIVTTKTSGTTTSEIEGWEIGDDGKPSEKRRGIDPKSIIGPYTDVAELAAKAAAEKAAREAVEKAKKDTAAALAFELYKITGLSKNDREYTAPFRVEYGGGVTINVTAVEAVLRALKTRVAA